MIGETLLFLKNQLSAHLDLGRIPAELQEEDLVVFIEGQNMEPLTFKEGTVSTLLINIEEENLLRSPNQFSQLQPDGKRLNVNPDIRLNLYVLFVAHFKDYYDSLRYLSRIISYFQNHRLIDHQNAPELNENIDQLIVELITLPFSEQNDIWNALRVTYHPSVLYKIKMVVFRDEDIQTPALIAETDLQISQ